MARAVCPGSFDPITRGHVDVIERAARQFEVVVVAIGDNMSKNGLFRPAERVSLVRDACAGLSGVEVALFDGLLVDFCYEIDADCIVKGLRAAGDFEYELPMARMNQRLSGIETVFLAAAPEWSFVSSSLVREVAMLGGDVSAYLPDPVAQRVGDRVRAAAVGRARRTD